MPKITCGLRGTLGVIFGRLARRLIRELKSLNHPPFRWSTITLGRTATMIDGVSQTHAPTAPSN